MPREMLKVVDGPDKPALQWAVAYPEREKVHFWLEGDGVDAQILSMEEQSGGMKFVLNGVLKSGQHKDLAFRGFYSIETRSGELEVNSRALEH